MVVLEFDPWTHPVVVATAVVVAALVIIAGGLSKALPPILEAWGTMAERRRRFKQDAEDARIVDLDQQVDHLAGRVATLEQRNQRQDAALIAHARWDAAIIQAAINAGVDVTPPPPLWPGVDL